MIDLRLTVGKDQNMRRNLKPRNRYSHKSVRRHFNKLLKIQLRMVNIWERM